MKVDFVVFSRERICYSQRERERAQTRTNHGEKERELTTKVISLIRFSTNNNSC